MWNLRYFRYVYRETFIKLPTHSPERCGFRVDLPLQPSVPFLVMNSGRNRADQFNPDGPTLKRTRVADRAAACAIAAALESETETLNKP